MKLYKATVVGVCEVKRYEQAVTPIGVHALFAAHCKATGKWGLLLGFGYVPTDNVTDITLAAPMLDFSRDGQAIIDGHAFLFYDTEEAMCVDFDRVVGDDGPTASNPYDGPVKVYALTCSPDGQLLDENT